MIGGQSCTINAIRPSAVRRIRFCRSKAVTRRCSRSRIGQFLGLSLRFAFKLQSGPRLDGARAQMIEDGLLMDLSDWARPVAGMHWQDPHRELV